MNAPPTIRKPAPIRVQLILHTVVNGLRSERVMIIPPGPRVQSCIDMRSKGNRI
jgi:hypothetical protein